MKNLIAVTLIAVSALFAAGCAFNAKEQVPGTSWKKAVIDVATNGVTHAEIDGYNSKKDVALSVNPDTHVVTLGSVMNPANTTAAGVANQITITANGDTAVKIGNAVAGAVGTGIGAAGAAGLTGH
jgi:hypothetical protein